MKRTLLLLVAAIGLSMGSAHAAGGMRSIGDLANAISHAHDVTLTSYWLPSDNPLVPALQRACARGARVSVVLASPGYDPRVATDNMATVNSLTSMHGNCTATTVSRPLHMKSVTTDGLIWLSDTNFTPRGYLYVSNDAQIDRTIADSVRDDSPHASGTFATGKAQALQLESSLITGSSGPVCISTEAFSDSGPIASTLFAALAQHRQVYLAVSPYELRESERALLRRFQDSGGRYTLSSADEKFAMVGTGPVWLGSANATTIAPPYGTQLDWGLVTNDQGIATDIARRCAQLAREAR